MNDRRYIQVILPLKLAWEPFYSIPADAEVRRGSRVRVNFAGREYVAVVTGTSEAPDVSPARIKDIIRVEERLEPIGDRELSLWRFISEYYLCTVGEVYKLAYPAIKTSGEETAANITLRREERLAREAEKHSRKIQKLRERLARKEEALGKKHSDKVAAQLAADRNRTACELEALLAADAHTDSEASAVDWRAQLPAAGMPCPGAAETADGLAEGRTVLIQGGDGRIGIEMEMAASTLTQGRDVLFLVPDIKLARHLQEKLSQRFGDFLHTVHSGQSTASRRDAAALLRLNLPGSGEKPTLILGTRSALFLPFRHLGLVIVEEEHDASYKLDTAPRYNSRDTAVMLGALHGAGVILSSPTPSLESILNSQAGKYKCVQVPASAMPVEVIDTSVERRKNGMTGNLSRVLISHIDTTLRNGGRVLILRPWGPLDDLEEELAGHWPDACADRHISVMTTYDARREELCGIALLAIVNAEAMLGKQDFRADERAMQTMEQLRSRLTGLMVVQTRQGTHQVFNRDIRTSSLLLSERKLFNYPPYTRMIDIIVRDVNSSRLDTLSSSLAAELSDWHPLGPYTPLKGRTPIEDTRHLRIILRRDVRLKDEKKKIADRVSDFEEARRYTGHIILDIDPA